MTEIRSGGPNELRIALDKWLGPDLDKWESAIHKKIHFQLVDGWIRLTPVGQVRLWAAYEKWKGGKRPPSLQGYSGGRARGGWQSSAVSPPAGETGRVDESGSQTRAANLAAINAIRPWSASYATNNVPYITALNDRPNPRFPGKGWSSQAPLQWIESVFEAVAAQFERGAG